jgi:hypothetical protein
MIIRSQEKSTNTRFTLKKKLIVHRTECIDLEYSDAFQVQTLFDSYARLESVIILVGEEDKEVQYSKSLHWKNQHKA